MPEYREGGMSEKTRHFRKRKIQHGALIEETWLNQQSRSRQQSFALIHLHAISGNTLLPGMEKKHICKWTLGDSWGFEIAEVTRKICLDKKLFYTVNAFDVHIMPPAAGTLQKDRTIQLDMPEKEVKKRYYVVLDRNIYVEQMFRIDELTHVKLRDPASFMGKLDEILSLIENGTPSPEKLSVMLFECLTILYSDSILPPEKVAGLPQYQLRQVTSYPQNFPTLRSLVEFFGVSRPTLTSLFKTHTGLSPMEFVICSKLNNSTWHLKYTDSSIGEIAFLHGYKDVSYYCNAFKKQFGISPSAYRKKYAEK